MEEKTKGTRKRNKGKVIRQFPQACFKEKKRNQKRGRMALSHNALRRPNSKQGQNERKRRGNVPLSSHGQQWKICSYGQQ